METTQQEIARRTARVERRESLKLIDDAYRDLIRFHEQTVAVLESARDRVQKQIDEIDDEVDREWAETDHSDLKRFLAEIRK